MTKADEIRRGYEAAHPAARRAREEFETMAAKVNAFLDIPAKLPERKYTEREKLQMRERQRLLALQDHVWWLSRISLYQVQGPLVPIHYVDL